MLNIWSDNQLTCSKHTLRFCFDDTVIIKYTTIEQIKEFLSDIYFLKQSLIPNPSGEQHVSLLYSYYGTSNPLMTAGASEQLTSFVIVI